MRTSDFNNDNNIKLLKCNINDKDMVLKFIKEENESFPIPLSARTDINHYVEKFLTYGNTYVFVEKERIIALISFYANDFENYNAYLTLICVSKDYRKNSILKLGYQLMIKMIDECKKIKMKSILLETDNNNYHAQKFYERFGFIRINENNNMYRYELKL